MSPAHIPAPEAVTPFAEQSRSETLLLTVHGICGHPGQLRPLARRIAERIPVDTAGLLLPGHGGSSLDFSRSTARQWQAHVDNALEGFTAQYRHVLLMGHSLGGLLCLDAATRHSVDGVFCIGTPMGTRSGAVHLKQGFLLLRDPKHDAEETAQARTALGIEVRGLPDYVLWLPPMLELLRFIRTVKRALPQVTVPVLLAQSDRDETIARRSASRIAARLGGESEQMLLPDSRHAHFSEPALNLLVGTVTERVAAWTADSD